MCDTPPMAFDLDSIHDRIERAARTVGSLRAIAPEIHAAATMIAERLMAGRTLLTCGNGGSAAEAMHLTEEIVGKYRDPRRPFPAVCLNADPTAITCIANDFGYDSVFSRQVEAFGRSGDVLVAFTTSGASPNVLKALDLAKRLGMERVGLLGKGGGVARGLCSHPIVVPDDAAGGDTGLIQEAHQVVVHLILEVLEMALSTGRGAHKGRDTLTS